MEKILRLMVVAGARPNFMKIAPLIQAARTHNAGRTAGAPEIRCQLVHTGQHYDEKMSDVFFRELGIPQPDFNLEVGSGSHASQTASIMTRFEPVLIKQRPDWLVVVGDVNSTVACALVASKLGVRVAHIEAGLRSFDRTMPEEINRLVTDAIADLLLPPSEDGCENPRREGVPEHKIKLVGNIMIDALVANLPAARESRMLNTLGLRPAQFAYVTLHRPANVDHRETLLPIMDALLALSPRLPVVFPMHPRTRKTLASFGFDTSRHEALHIIEPIGYHDSLNLAENARLILTDSGGLQEEATYFQTPCLTLRPNTERPITLTVGSNQLTSLETLGKDIIKVLNREPRFGDVPAMWDGNAAHRIVKCLTSQN